MRRTFYLLAALWLATLSAGAQSVSQLPTLTPFRLEPGSSFSASGEKKSEPKRSKLSAESERIVGDFADALEVIRHNHVDGRALDNDALTKSSINTMLGELDPHSTYFDTQEFGALLGEQNSEYSGTGSTISNFLRDGRIETYVVAVQRGSAAARANLRYGDRIVSVDGFPVTGSMVDVVRDRVRGPRGTTVRLVVERASNGAIETIDLKRERISQPSVRNPMLIAEGTGYIDLTDGFSHTTSAEFSLALNDLTRRGMRSLVLDLRENGGGILDQAVKIAEKFLPSGTLVISQRGRDPVENLTWRSENRLPANFPLVVLVNGRTASAAEIVAGALQDNDRALIIGQNTFGKGLVQTVLELPAGSGLTLTTARYFTPSGRSIQRTYNGAGLYNYYNHRQAAADPGKTETRTVTNRKVFGGDGITPDEIVPAESFDPRRAGLIDPIFFYVRDLSRAGSRAVSEQAMKEYIARFRSYASGPVWKIEPATLDAESVFIKEQIEYQFALAIDGPEAADRQRIKADKEISRAIAALPRASALAESARRANRAAETKKPAQVAFPGGLK
jgi:carboxyl-terminal processing protease